MNRLFEEFQLGPWFSGEEGGEMAWSPRVNLSENEKELVVSAELPGMDEKNIDVSVSNDVLSIRGEKTEEKEEKEQDYHRVERRFGTFQRDIPLPAEVESDKVDATFKNGVLTIHLPKSPQAQTDVRKIQVKAE